MLCYTLLMSATSGCSAHSPPFTWGVEVACVLSIFQTSFSFPPPNKKSRRSILPSVCKRRRHNKMPTSAPQTFRSRMQLNLRTTRRAFHDACRLVHAISAWFVKTRRAPGHIVGMRESMVLRSMTMHDTVMSSTSTPSLGMWPWLEFLRLQGCIFALPPRTAACPFCIVQSSWSYA